MDRNGVHVGDELRGPTIRPPILGGALPVLRSTPVLEVDDKTFEELKWTLNPNIVGGLEWHRTGSSRRVRFLLNYYNGFPPLWAVLSTVEASDGRVWVLPGVLRNLSRA